MRDFNLYLPENEGLSKLAIVPEFEGMNPLIQRAVCLLVSHEDPRLSVDGIPLMSFVQKASTKSTAGLAQMLSGVADRLKELLNQDNTTVSSVEFLVSLDGNRLKVDINILPTNSEDSVSSVLYYA